MENPQKWLRIATERHSDDPPERHKQPRRLHLKRRAGTVTLTDFADATAAVFIQTNAAGEPISTVTQLGPGPSVGINQNISPVTAEPTSVVIPAVVPIPTTPQTSPRQLSTPSAPAPVTESPIVSSPTTLSTTTSPPIIDSSSSSSTLTSKPTTSTTSLAVPANGAKPTEGSASSTPLVAGAVIGSVGGLTILLLIVLILIRWYKNRRRALSVQGAGSNDSAANLAGPSGPHGGFGGAGGAGSNGGTFRVIGNEESKEMTAASRRGIIPSPAFFSDRLSKDKQAPNSMMNPNMPPYSRTQEGQMPNDDDGNEITVIGGGPSRTPYKPGPLGGFSNNHTTSPTQADNVDGRLGGRSERMIPFPMLQDERGFNEHEHNHDHEGFTHSFDEPSSVEPTMGEYHRQDYAPGTPGPLRHSDGMSVTSLYRDSWPPGPGSGATGGAAGVKPLFLNSGRAGGVRRESAERVDDERPESLAIWPGPGAAKEIEQWKAGQAVREYPEGQRIGMNPHAIGVQDNPPAVHAYHDGDAITSGGAATTLSPLPTQVQQHLGDPGTGHDDSNNLNRETLRPSPARTPQVHPAEPDMYPFPERASPHDERNGSNRLPGAASAIGGTGVGGGHGVGSIERKPVAGTSPVT